MSKHDDHTPDDRKNWPFFLPGPKPESPEEKELWNSPSARFERQALRLDAKIGIVSAQLELGLKLLVGKCGFKKNPKVA
ncbi:MAG: hypothetical protein IJG25_00870, partial [Thermoguttaceae bacterium]|nr:hypothetical protein [Thermoguttaceae bacterium]